MASETDFDAHPWERPIGDQRRQDRDIAAHPYDRQEHRVCSYLRQASGSVECGDDPIGVLITSHTVLSGYDHRRQRREIEEIIKEQLCKLDALCGDKNIALAVADYRSAEAAVEETHKIQMAVQQAIARSYKARAEKLKAELDEARAELAIARARA